MSLNVDEDEATPEEYHRRLQVALGIPQREARRARAQAQPRGDGGRFCSGDPWVKLRQSELEKEREWWRRRYNLAVAALKATIAERDAEVAELKSTSRHELGAWLRRILGL